MRWIAFVAMVICCCLAWGNGIYIPETAILEMPRIPTQRAFINYRDGVETLILESSLTTRSANVGWIVPLPAEPTRIDVGDKDMLTMLWTTQQPYVIHDLGKYFEKPILYLISFTPLALTLIFMRRSLGCAIAIGVALLFVVLVVVPQFTNAGMELEKCVGVSAVHRMGEYEASVLRATDAQAISKWLASQSLQPLTAEGARIAQQYIGQGWCFVVTRLRLDATDLLTPRPLVLTFPAKSCTFPMKLTQLANTTTQVDLCIASDRQAQATGFRCIAADRYDLEKSEYEAIVPGYRGKQIGLNINNPDLGEYLWPNCVVTRLAAQLKPEQMISDVDITFGDLKPYQETVYTPLARQELTLLILLWGLFVCFVLAAIVCRGRRKPGKTGGSILIATGLLVLFASAGVNLFLPVTPVIRTFYVYEYFVNSMLQGIQSNVMLLCSQGEINADTQPKDILPLIVSQTNSPDKPLINPCTNLPIIFERTPGNISLRKKDGKTYFCMYDLTGREIRNELPPAPGKPNTKK